jgi:hypothetical protein
MSRLIPTAVVDKNGRQTTVHKRADAAPSAKGVLAGVRPALGAVQPQEVQHTIKLKGLTSGSTAMLIVKERGMMGNEEVDEFLAGAGRKTASLPDDLIYDFLRKGVDAENAAALVTLGLDNPDDVPGDDSSFLIYNLKRVSGAGHYIWRRKIDDVIDRFQENGVPATVASKVIRNGLQDDHLDDALSDDQLIELFSKWTYKSTVGYEDKGRNEQDRVIKGFINGELPFDLIDLKMNELKGVEYELSALALAGPAATDTENKLLEKFSDRDYLTRVARKAATSVDGYRPMQTLDGLIEKHGPEVMELRNPQMAGVEIHLGNYQSNEIGVEAARYIEQVHDVMDKDSDRAYWMSGERYSSHGGKQIDRVYVRNADLLELREAGLSPEESYDMLVKHKLKPEQIIVARQTGVESTLASGVL